MLKILHGADFHLDAPFGALRPELAAQRRGEQRELLERLADLAIEKKVDLVLLSGDLLDGDTVYRETGEALAAALGRIPAPVFIAPGNHDCYGPRSVYATLVWPDNVHIFSAVAVESKLVAGLNCVVHGAAFTTALADRSPLMGFTAPQDGRIHVMALHGDVAPRSRYGPIAAEQIAASGLDYLALGHIHQCSGLQKTGETYWAYPGCPEGRGFDELGDKGVLLLTLGETVGAEFIPLAGRRYGILEVRLDGDDPALALERALPGGEERDCYRVIFTGQRAQELNLPGLEALVANRFFSVSFRDRTAPWRDLWARAEEETLTGLFLRGMQRRLAAAEEPGERARIEQAARLGLAALENGEDLP